MVAKDPVNPTPNTRKPIHKNLKLVVFSTNISCRSTNKHDKKNHEFYNSTFQVQESTIEKDSLRIL